MERTSDIFSISSSFLEYWLTMTTYIGYKLYTFRGMYEHSTILFMFECRKISDIWYSFFVSNIARTLPENSTHLIFENFLVSIYMWRERMHKAKINNNTISLVWLYPEYHYSIFDIFSMQVKKKYPHLTDMWYRFSEESGVYNERGESIFKVLINSNNTL